MPNFCKILLLLISLSLCSTLHATDFKKLCTNIISLSDARKSRQEKKQKEKDLQFRNSDSLEIMKRNAETISYVASLREPIVIKLVDRLLEPTVAGEPLRFKNGHTDPIRMARAVLDAALESTLNINVYGDYTTHHYIKNNQDYYLKLFVERSNDLSQSKSHVNTTSEPYNLSNMYDYLNFRMIDFFNKDPAPSRENELLAEAALDGVVGDISTVLRRKIDEHEGLDKYEDTSWY